MLIGKMKESRDCVLNVGKRFSTFLRDFLRDKNFFSIMQVHQAACDVKIGKILN